MSDEIFEVEKIMKKEIRNGHVSSSKAFQEEEEAKEVIY